MWLQEILWEVWRGLEQCRHLNSEERDLPCWQYCRRSMSLSHSLALIRERPRRGCPHHYKQRALQTRVQSTCFQRGYRECLHRPKKDHQVQSSQRCLQRLFCRCVLYKQSTHSSSELRLHRSSGKRSFQAGYLGS